MPISSVIMAWSGFASDGFGIFSNGRFRLNLY
jgi:hypothetical protein